jgi:hypothetical protein
MTRQRTAPIVHLGMNALNVPVESLVFQLAKGRMTLDTPYQRGPVWTIEQKTGLIESLCMGIPIPAIIRNNRMSSAWTRANGHLPADSPGYAVIDGKQRLLTLVAWHFNKLAVPASWFPANQVAQTETYDDGPYVKYSGLTELGQRTWDNRAALPVAEAQLPTLAEEARVYGLVNGAGTAQTAEDMARAAAIAGEG